MTSPYADVIAAQQRLIDAQKAYIASQDQVIKGQSERIEALEALAELRKQHEDTPAEVAPTIH